jgi:hypothetical protein
MFKVYHKAIFVSEDCLQVTALACVSEANQIDE